MLTLPAKTRRRKQPYLSLRSQLTERNLRRQATVFYSELREFIARRGIEDAGPPFMRYHSIGRAGDIDMEFGFFTARVHAGSGPVRSGQLPAGVFLTAEWIGPYENLVDAQAMLAGWAQQNHVAIDAREGPEGLVFGCRLKVFHVASRQTDDPRQYRTEFMMLTRPVEGGSRGHSGAGSAPSLAHFPMVDCLNE